LPGDGVGWRFEIATARRAGQGACRGSPRL